MKKLAFTVAALALAIPAVASAQGKPWKISADIGGNHYDISCTFQIADGKISGPCTSPAAPGAVQATGSYTDKTSELSYDLNMNGQKLHVVYKGEMQADGSSKGTVEAGGASGTYTAAPAG